MGQGKIIDALRLAKSLPGGEAMLSARKYLEAAIKGDPLVFYSVYSFFQQRNVRLRGVPDFLKSMSILWDLESSSLAHFILVFVSGELCNEYQEYYQNTFCK